MSSARKRRRQLIVELVARNEVMNQEQLQVLLRDEGVEATQATISRDLRDLGITKGPNGYVHIPLDDVVDAEMEQLRESLRSHVRSVSPAGTLLVLRTTERSAGELASLLDRAKIPQCLGTIAGDDTVMIATRSVGQASELARIVQRLMRSEAQESR